MAEQATINIVPFSKEQFEKLQRFEKKFDAVRRLLNAADFGNCQCKGEVAGAALIAEETYDEFVCELFGPVRSAFRDLEKENV